MLVAVVAPMPEFKYQLVPEVPEPIEFEVKSSNRYSLVYPTAVAYAGMGIVGVGVSVILIHQTMPKGRLVTSVIPEEAPRT